MQIRQAASGLELTEEQFVELQSQQWARFYSICVQYQQVVYYQIYLSAVSVLYCYICTSVFLKFIPVFGKLPVQFYRKFHATTRPSM